MTKSNERSVMTDAQALAVLVRIEQDLGSITENDATGLHRYLRARLASTSFAPDGFGAFVRFGWVCEGDLIFDQAEADEARDSGGDVTTLYTAAPQPVVEKENG